MRRYKNNIRKDLAVSEIMGTILMLGIATTTFSGISYYILSTPAPTPAPIVEISGEIDDNQVIVTHCGGELLDLDTEIFLNIGGSYKSYKIGDFLDCASKEDGVWGLGEKFIYPLDYEFDYVEYPNADIIVVDKVSNSLIFDDFTKINPLCDISVEISVDNLYPKEFENVEITIKVKNNGNINVSGVEINCLLPEGLSYVSSNLQRGSYESSCGILSIDKILRGESVEVDIIATVGDVVNGEPTQLVVILDGSESIEPANWTLMLTGLSEAVKNESRFSHNGGIELTIIQFGGQKPAYAQLEIGPIIITKSNVDSVVDDILKITQIYGKTPTSCAFLMAADILKESDMFDPDIRQICLLVTDGNPTHCGYSDGDYLDDKCNKSYGPKDNAIDNRDYLIELLDLDGNNDEINALSIEVTGDGHTYYLRDDLVWPQPGYTLSDDDFTEDSPKGWIKNIDTWEDFAEAINLSFDIMLNSIKFNIKIISTGFYDPKEINDVSSITLKPKPTVAAISEELPMEL